MWNSYELGIVNEIIVNLNVLFCQWNLTNIANANKTVACHSHFISERSELINQISVLAIQRIGRFDGSMTYDTITI